MKLKSIISLAAVYLITLTIPTACESFEEESPDHAMTEAFENLLDTKASRLGDNYEVTQQMAELFLASNKDIPEIISVEPYCIEGITCFYIFNLERGFKVIAADTRIQPFLGESDRGHLSIGEIDNPGMKYWLDDTAERIYYLKTENPETTEDYSELWSAYSIPNDIKSLSTRSEDIDSLWVIFNETTSEYIYNNANVGPLLTTEWGQQSPWNSKMPKVSNSQCLTGCVAVAASQVLYYFNRINNTPNDFWHSIAIQSSSICTDHGGRLVTLTKSGHTNNSAKWNQMAKKSNESNTDIVSNLMLDLGERLGMHYGTSNSFVLHASDRSIPTLSNCGINYSFGAYSFTQVENEILNGKPIIITGWTTLTNANGHTWVIDGCRDYSCKYTTTVTYICIHPDELINYHNYSGVLTYDEMMTLHPEASNGVFQVIQSERYDNQKSLYMNWGWSGDNNGWYSLLNNDWTAYPYSRVIHYNISTTQLY